MKLRLQRAEWSEVKFVRVGNENEEWNNSECCYGIVFVSRVNSEFEFKNWMVSVIGASFIDGDKGEGVA